METIEEDFYDFYRCIFFFFLILFILRVFIAQTIFEYFFYLIFVLLIELFINFLWTVIEDEKDTQFLNEVISWYIDILILIYQRNDETLRTEDILKTEYIKNKLIG